MTYNARIKSVRSGITRVSGSSLSVTGSIISSGDITASVGLSGSSGTIGSLTVNTVSASAFMTGSITGSNARFTAITASAISASSYIGISAGSTPGGTNQSVQFNSGSQLSGNTSLIYDYTTNTLSGTTAQFTSITGSHSGNSTTATTLQSARTISSTGDVVWSVSFDGSGNVSGSATIQPGVIVDADINASAAISDSKLATISTAGKVSNSATTATSANTANAIVARDASGNFSAGTISATFSGSHTGSISGSTAQFISITGSHSGNSTTATALQNSRTISSTGDVVWSVSFDGSANVSGSATIQPGVIVDADINASAAIADTKLATISTAGKVSNSATTATSANTANAIVARDASGNFSAGTISATFSGSHTGSISGSTAQFLSITGSHTGSGAGLTNIPNGALTNSSVTIGSTNISLGGTSTTLAGITQLTASSAFIQGNVTINGTASVAQLNTVNQTSLLVGDKYITILSGGVDHSGIDGAGLLWGSSSGPGETTGSLGEHAHLLYDATRDALKIFPGLYVTGSTTLSSISGTTAQFTSITGAVNGTASFASDSHLLDGLDSTAFARLATSNTFSSINQFNTNYITASAGITGSDARFTSITGALNGNATTATNSTNASRVNINGNVIDNNSYYLPVTLTSSGNADLNINTNLRYNPSTNTLSTTNFSGSFTGSFSGTLSSGIATNVTSLTGNTTLNSTHHVLLVSASSADITLTLPTAASSPYRQYIIKKTDATAFRVVISGSSGQTIDGATGRALNIQYETVSIVSDGSSNWYIL